MPNVITYFLLSLGVGATYALLGNGIVAIFKGSGVLNFSQGAVAMFAAYCFSALHEHNVPKFLNLAIVLAGSAVVGALIAVLIFRPLRTAPVLAKVAATLGLLLGLQGLAQLIWGTTSRLAPSLFPTNTISIGNNAFLGVDRLYMVATVIPLALLLWAGYRFTRPGLATQAASENERGAALLGFSPTTIAALNWALGFALAALAGILIAPLTTLEIGSLPLLVLPALAAALIGNFSSFGITTVAAFVIAWIEAYLASVWTAPGIATATPFVIAILVMVLVGRPLPTRGGVSTGRPPRAPLGRGSRLVPAAIGCAAVIVALVVLNTTYQAAVAASLTSAVVALSLVVLTGYVGQISLMQLTFAGLGAFVTAKLASNYGIPFPLPILIAAVVVPIAGAVLGLPALRVRGLSLAVVTLGAAIAVNAVFFSNETLAGGLNGVPVPSATLWGFSLDPFEHTVRYGIFTLIVLLLVALLVGNLRRSGLGRRMLAVRSSERAAAVAGVNVAAVKIQAFMFSSLIAAIGGGMLAYSNSFVTFGSGSFAVLPSITLLTVVYIGGIASVSGGITAGFISAGGVLYVAMSGIPDFTELYLLISGAGLVWTVISNPDGGAVFMGDQFGRALQRLRERTVGRAIAATEPPAASSDSSA
jgi:branched-chain amino acid transport system permease protein